MKLRRLVLPLLLLTSPARAHQEDAPQSPRERDRAPTYDPREFRSNQFLAVELRIGPYRPRVDDEFAGATPFNDVFGPGESIAIGLEVDWQALRIPHLGTFGPGLAMHFVRYAGIAPTLSGAESAHPTALWMLPMGALAVLRVDVLARDFRIPIVPYAKAGFAYAIWNATDAGNTSTAPDGSFGEGAEYGFQIHGGGMLHLNWFAPQAALDMDNSTGVNNAYLFFEWMYSDVDSFDSGMQVGTSTWFAGLAVEY